MKKLFLTLTMMFATCICANAAVVGYVNYQVIVTKYPLAVKYQKELESKSASLKTYLDKKETEIKGMKSAAEQANAKKSALAEIEKRQKEYVNLKNAREKELDAKIKVSVEKVRVQKKLEVIVKSDVVISGGVDCTQDVLNNLK